MAHDSNLTLISDDLPQSDACKETPNDLVSPKQDNGISVHGGSSVSSGGNEQELHADKEGGEETSEKQEIPPDENPTTQSMSDTTPRRSIEKPVPVLVISAPSLPTPASSTESWESSEKELEFSLEKVLGETTTSILDEAEIEASKLMRKETSEEDSPDESHSLMSCTICQLFVRTVDRLLDKSEEMMDQYMPLTEEEISNLKQAVKELDSSLVDHQKTACFDRITSLSSRLRQRAYMMALGKLRMARRNTHSNLSQLHQTLDLIEQTQQGEEPEFQKNQERLEEICSQWTQQRKSSGEILPYKQEEVPPPRCGPTEADAPLSPDGSTVEDGVPVAGITTEAGASPFAVRRSTVEADVPFAKKISSEEAQMIVTVPGCREENGFTSTEVESKTLEMSRTLTLDLQGTYKSLLSNLEDLPLNLKNKLYQSYRHMAELHAKFSTAHSFADLPGSFLEKGLVIMAQAQESMDEVMEFAFQNPMAVWAEDHPPAPVMTETPSPRQEVRDIMKIQAAYDPKGCDENDQ